MSMAKQDVALQPRHTHTHNISSNDALLKAAAVGAGGVGASDGGGGTYRPSFERASSRSSSNNGTISMVYSDDEDF